MAKAFGHLSPEYQAYMGSATWRKRAAACKERAGHRCQVCNADGDLDAHHRTYARFMNEEDGDLTALCRKCHDLFHGSKKKATPKKKRRKPKAKKRRQKKAKEPKLKKAPQPRKPSREDLRVEALNKKLRENKLRKAALETAAIRNAERRRELADRLDAEERQAEASEALPV